MDDVKRKVMTQPEKIQYIISRSCTYFGVSQDAFFEKSGTRGNTHKIKRYIAYILSSETEISQSEISTLLGFYNRDAVCVSISKIKEALSDNFYGDKKTKTVYKELLTYINL